MDYQDPILIGDLLRKLFIIRPDGSVDHDMVVALAQAALEHEPQSIGEILQNLKLSG